MTDDAPEPKTLLPADALSVLHEGRQAYVAVDATTGPHVTPELYAYSGDRIWFAAASSTVKAKVLQRTSACAMCIAVPGRAVLVQGTVECFDVRRPRDLVSRAPEALAATRALLSYAARNVPDLLSFGADLGRGRLGFKPPPIRTLFAMEPLNGAIVERATVTQGWGTWTDAPARPASPARTGGIPVVAAVPGPMAMPASWFPEDEQLHLDAGLDAHLPPGSPFEISFVGDEYSAPGPDAKSGLLLRGVAYATCEPTELMIELDRAVEWDGVETSTTPLGP